jgi:dGTPase
MRELNHALKSFLREHVYRHYKVRRMTSKARRVVTRAVRGVWADPG